MEKENKKKKTQELFPLKVYAFTFDISVDCTKIPLRLSVFTS